MTTRFTIAIPTHDRRDTALLSARSALAQSRAAQQVLILCDGCTDGTAEALRGLGDPRIEVIELPKAAGYAYVHRNRALELASGDVILWLADDDLLMPGHLETIGELWDTGEYDLIQSHGVVIYPDDHLEWFGSDWSVPAARAALARSNSNPMSSVSVRTELVTAAGGWDPKLSRAADWDLWQRLLDAGARCAGHPEPTVLHFRASGREQDWPDRVQQNGEWLARLRDPDEARALRIRLRRAGAAHAANLDQRAGELAQRSAALEEQAAALNAQRGSDRHELSAERERADALERRLAETAAERRGATESAAQAHATLALIYAGGWWRPRKRLSQLRRLFARGR